MKTLTETTIRKIVRNLIKGEDYRVEIVELINTDFLDYVIEFFKKIVHAKLKNDRIGIEWYVDEFLNDKLSSSDLAIHSGLNMKTIFNMHKSSKREIVIDFTNDHFFKLYESIENLVDNDSSFEVELTITFNGVSVKLDIRESLIVINTLAVKRAALRGGLWSTAGKSVEAPLMKTLCKIFKVENQFFKTGSQTTQANDVVREIDFYLINESGTEHKCEVKLMGSGNPEGADSVFARESKVFIADKLSENNKKQLDREGIEWVELRSTDGFMRFEKVLGNIGVPYISPGIIGDSKIIENAIDQVFHENSADEG